MKSIFSTPKVVKYDDLKKPWFVYFRYDGKLFRYKYGINYINNFKEREKEANLLRDALCSKLKEGWNPNIQENHLPSNSFTIMEALDYAFEKKKNNISTNTFKSYEQALNFFRTAVTGLRLESMMITDVKRVHVKTIFERIQKDRSWSNKSYNKNLGYIKAVFSELLQWDIIEVNPSHNIKLLPVGETIANTPATDDEVTKIKEKLTAEFPNFYNFIVTIFHTGIRPYELLQVRVGMIHLDKREMNLPPEITKTDIARTIPINKFLLDIFTEMNIKNSKSEFYIFGSNREFSNRGLKPELDFTPGKNMLNRDAASKLWRKLVKEDMGINANMYSMKHLGANKKIIAGMDLDSLRELYGHTSKMMTMRYAKVVKDVYRKNIIEHSPDF